MRHVFGAVETGCLFLAGTAAAKEQWAFMIGLLVVAFFTGVLRDMATEKYARSR